MGILRPDRTTDMGGVKVNEYLLTAHNSRNIAMPSASMEGKVIGVTVHNTDWITVADGTTPAEQYTRATVNGNMADVRVHFYVDNTCAWQNLPLSLSGWHAADGNGDGNRRTIAIECIMSGDYTDRDKKSEDNAARLAAELLRKYGLGIDRLYTHQHWYSRKCCPAYILPHWDEFRNKVEGYLNAGKAQSNSKQKELYRIRRTWNDVKSQIGAFSTIEAAKKVWKQGYIVYDDSGKAVYPAISEHSETIQIELRQLRIGAKGKDVKSLQQLLFAEGYNLGSCGIDGEFGTATERAVMEFQSDKHIAIDGIAGANTWAEIFKWR